MKAKISIEWCDEGFFMDAEVLEGKIEIPFRVKTLCYIMYPTGDNPDLLENVEKAKKLLRKLGWDVESE